MLRRSLFLPAAVGAVLLAAGCRSGSPGVSSFAPAPARSGPLAASASTRQAAADGAVGGSAPQRRPKAAVGEPAPPFELADVRGRTVRLADYKGKTVVLEWFSPTCPYSAFAWSEAGPLRELSERLQSQGTVWLTINSETPENAGGQSERTAVFARENRMRVPLLLDPTGRVGQAYEAKTTPHMYVISSRGVLVYRGALDNAPLGKVREDAAKTNYVEAALADLKSGRAVTAAETKPYGRPIHYAKQ